MNALVKLLAILCPLGVMHLAVEAADPSAEVKNGIWLGTLKTPNGQEFRMVIEVFPKADGTTAAVLDILDQGRMGMPFDEITFSEGRLRWGMSAAGLVIAGKASEDLSSIDATWEQGGGKLPLPLKAVEEVPGPPPRPQTPRRPYPYQEQQVIFENADAGVKLSGTLTLPGSPRPTAAVLLVAGSGPRRVFRSEARRSMPMLRVQPGSGSFWPWIQQSF